MDHPLRSTLAGELHARPFLKLETPVSLEHFAVYAEDQPRIHEVLLQTLCSEIGIATPSDGLTHFAAQLPNGCQVKWERHTEFSTFTIVAPRPHDDYFCTQTPPSLPATWQTKMAGARFVAVRMELLTGPAARSAPGDLRRWFDGPTVVGSKVLGGGKVFCDWCIRPDGFMRFLVIDDDFRESQGGRLLQRLHEIETYRMMALLALPIARQMNRDLDEINASLQALMRRMEAACATSDDAALLVELTHLAVRIESLAGHGSRFSASRAYEMLVINRIQELREERIDGMPTIAEFMERRFAPAMQTCRSVWSRHEQTAQRIARAVDLLRTRVNLAQEKDVTRLLAGMERTARSQLHLQHAVEGLSVAAISYYVLSLAGAAFRALHELQLPILPELAEGILILPVILSVIAITRRTRQHMRASDTPAPFSTRANDCRETV
ncbi:putative membrane-anchored protein [Paraburkholderia sp. MM5482-R2]